MDLRYEYSGFLDDPCMMAEDTIKIFTDGMNGLYLPKIRRIIRNKDKKELTQVLLKQLADDIINFHHDIDIIMSKL